jgi:methylated-DNA-protein-cysteine methyltransferase-like protein
MANSAAYARIKSELVSIVASIPAGYVSTHGAMGRHLAVYSRHVAYILATLDEMERETIPWWRVVADGGAIGRHQRRDDQMARLRQDGVPLSGVGIVQELAERRVSDLSAPPAAPFPRRSDPAAAGPSRSRGMKSHPPSP